MIESLKKLISIPSVKDISMPGMPFGEHVHNALMYMLSQGESFGLRAVNVDGYAGYLEIGHGKKMVAALCHLDVVPPGSGWTTDPYLADIRDGKIYGRGALDDKGPAIAVLFAMKQLVEQGYNESVRIRLILGLDEERGSTCMNRYIKTEEIPVYGFTPDGNFPVIHCEKGILQLKLVMDNIPSANDIENIKLKYIKGGELPNMVPGDSGAAIICKKCCLDNIMSELNTLQGEYNIEYIINVSEQDEDASIIKLKVFGKSAHASTPEEGDNAILKTVKILKRLFSATDMCNSFVELMERRFGDKTDGSLFGCEMSDSPSGKLTFNTGIINMEESHAEISVDIRYPVTVKEKDVLKQVEEISNKEGLKVEKLHGMAPLYFPKNHHYVRLLNEVYSSATGDFETLPIVTGGGTYARKIPGTLAFGPIFPGEPEVFHMADEYISLQSLVLCNEIYKEALLRTAQLAVQA